MRIRIAAILLAVATTLILIAGTPGTASAGGDCGIGTKINPATGTTYYETPIAWSPSGNTYRAGCFNVGVVGTPNGFYFTAYAKDWVDRCTDGSGCVQDLYGNSLVQWHYCDGSTPWVNAVWDWSVNPYFNESVGLNQVWTSPWMHPAENGYPQQFCFRYAETARYRNWWHQWVTSWHYGPEFHRNA